MTKEELIDKILSDLYLNSNRALDFYENFSIYENDINRLDEVKSIMEKEDLITTYKNKKTGISPKGFKICFEGGYLQKELKKERQIRRAFAKKKMEIAQLNRKLRNKNRLITFILLLLFSSLLLVAFISLGLVDLSI